MESTRSKEAEVKKETADQLETFRRQQEEAEKASNVQEAAPPVEGSENWTAGPRKRKKGREGAIGGVKLRRVSTTEKQPASDQGQQATIGEAAAKDASSIEAAIAEASRTELHPSPDDKEGPTGESSERKSTSVPAESVSPDPKPPSVSPPAGLGLAAYSSDEDD
jgi:hypothetical protein